MLIDTTHALWNQQKAGWLHCDIKANNIVLVDQGLNEWTAKMIDLGLSVRADEPQHPDTKQFHSDPANYSYNRKNYPHLAPEMLRAETGDTFETEIFALGSLITECGVAHDIDYLVEVGKRCQEEDREKRPTIEMVHASLEVALEQERVNIFIIETL